MISGRRESRTLKAYRSTAFEAAAVANRLALPFLAAEAGIEPAPRRLTVAFPYQHRTHRIVVFVATALALASSQARRASVASQDDWTRTSDLVLPRHAGCQTSPRPEFQSAQRESNPHFRHGKAVGCRYIMGACRVFDCQRSRAPGGTRTRVAALRERCLRR